MHLVCSWTGYHVITSSSPCHLQCGSLLSPSSKLRFTSLKEELGHCWTMLISAKARCIFSWGLWQSAPKWSLFNKGISSNWILKKKKQEKNSKWRRHWRWRLGNPALCLVEMDPGRGGGIPLDRGRRSTCKRISVGRDEFGSRYECGLRNCRFQRFWLFTVVSNFLWPLEAR